MCKLDPENTFNYLISTVFLWFSISYVFFPCHHIRYFTVTHTKWAFQDVVISLFLNSLFSIYRPDKCLLYSSVIDTKENILLLTTLCIEHVHSITHPHHQ